MKRETVAAILMTAALAAPAWAARPFGVFDGKVTGGNAATGILPLAGWALDDDGIEAVDIYVDGVIVGRAGYGFNRPDVEATFPGFPDSKKPGFGYLMDTTRFLNGSHSVSAEAISKTGERRILNALSFQFENTVQNLVPFGAINFPNRNSELFGNCDLNDPNRRDSVISGWALDAGIQEEDRGVGYVELLIDGSIFANTRTDCFFDNDLGGLSNCYGLRRFDIERQYPFLVDAPLSGFRFVMDIGFLINFGYREGQHVLTIRAGDKASQVDNIAEIPVTFICDDRVGNEGSFGFIEAPMSGEPFSGSIPAFGWALDREGVAEIHILIDGVDQGLAPQGIPRPDVNAVYPGFPQSLAPGWFFTIDTTAFSDGTHQMQVLVRDVDGIDTVIGETTFIVDNQHP